MGRAHRLAGLATLAAFLITGFYLRFGLRLEDGEHAIRYLFRANHVYILLAGLVNLALGAYLVPAARPWRRRAQQTGSALLLAATAALLAAFALEPPRGDPHRPITSLAVLGLFAGTLLHLAGARPPRPDPGAR